MNSRHRKPFFGLVGLCRAAAWAGIWLTLTLAAAPAPVEAQDPDPEQDSEQSAEERRIRRLKDSLATDPSAEWVPGQSASPVEEQVQRKLLLGNRALDAGDLVEPPNANALEFFQEALELNPDSAEARQGVQAVADALMARARRAADAGDREGALALVEQVAALRPNDPELESLRAAVSRNEELEAMLDEADALMEAGRLTGTQGETALAKYRSALAIEARNPRALGGLERIARSLVSEAREAVSEGEFDRALGRLAEAEGVSAAGIDYEAERQAVSAARDAANAQRIEAVRDAIAANDLDTAGVRLSELRSSGAPEATIAELDAAIDELRLLQSYTAGMTFNDETGPTLVVVGRGEFSMGSANRESGRSDNEGPRQDIRIARPFALTQTEITVAQFRRFVDATGYVSDAEKNGQSTIYNVLAGSLKDEAGVHWRQDFQGQDAKDEDPVIHVSWNDAEAFANWLSEQTGQRYRLPSEAEFEYALRAGTQTRYWWGNDRPRSEVENLTGDGDKIAGRWEWPNPFQRYRDGHWGPAPAGSFETNPFGLFDMGGNVMEWVADCYEASLEGLDAGGAARQSPNCGLHVLKGGSWASPPDLVRSAYRSSAQSDRTSCLIGFRLARDL